MQIIIDESNIETYSDAFMVMDDNSFVEARKKILEHKKDGQKNKLIVVSKYPYSAWFSDIENETWISLERVLPSKKLKEKFKNVELDKELDEKDIVYLDLLHQTIEPTEVSIINKYVGAFLLNDSDLINQLYQITAYASIPPKHFIESKYLRKKWAKYLERIEFNSLVIRSLLSKLKDADPDFCKVINRLIYVSNSQNLLREWMHDYRAYIERILLQPVQDLEKFLAQTHFSGSVNEQYELEIERYFKILYNEDITEFFQEKGDYKASLRAFLFYAKSITHEEKEFIFSNYKRNIDIELEEKIRALIKPELLIPPVIKGLSLSMQIKEWHKWAVESFIPFKFYLDDSPNQEDLNLVEEYSNTYSDWLFNSYTDIIQSGIKTNYNITNLINIELDNFNVVWLIIDGFPSTYTEPLISILKSNGINKIHSDYHFAAIPTITKIGIPTQLSGRFPNVEGLLIDRTDSLKQSFHSKKVIFENKINSFAKALESDFDVCCLHWREIDEFMHKNDSDIDTSRIEEIKRLLNNRILQIANIIKANADKKIKLIISTDHGITKCLTKGLNIKNSYLLQACLDNPKERCIELTGSLSKVNLDENETYYLKAEQTLNLNNWVVAKGYRYFGRFDYGYRHGGLTPEETIVPFLTCEIAQNEILPLKVVYGGLSEIQLGFTVMLKLHISNDNDAVIEILKIEIKEDQNFVIDASKQISPFSSKTFEGKIKLPKSIIVKEDKANIHIFVDYNIFGEKLENEFIINVPIKKPENKDLDNLFN